MPSYVRTIRPRPRPTIPLIAGPFRGMRDSHDPTSSDPTLAALLQNVYPTDPERRMGVFGRPGLRVFDEQIGAGSSRGQRSYQFTKLDGTEISMVICAGQIYTLNWSTRQWSLVVTTANLTTAGVTLDSAARVFLLTFANTVVVSDGTNQPFTWDGTSGAGGLTPLTNTNAAGWYGQPTVYYGKLFGIRADDRSTFEWSEENQANTGYGAGGFNNVWTLGQTDQEPLYLLVGTNEQLGVFRARSATAIGGAVTEDFQSSGTREALSPVIGTESPASAVFDKEGRLHFMSADLQPHVWTPGGGITGEWEDFTNTISFLERDIIAKAISIYDPLTELVLHGVGDAGETENNLLMGLLDGQPCTVWRGFPFTSIDMLKNAAGKPVVVHLTADGYVYDHGLPEGESSELVLTDELAAGDAAIQHTVVSPYLGYDEYYEKFFSRLDLSLRTVSNMTGLSAQLTTPSGLSSTLSFDVAGSSAEWDSALWDTDVWASDSVELHKALGFKAWGRWVQYRLNHAAVDEQFGFLRGRVTAHIRGAFPEVL